MQEFFTVNINVSLSILRELLLNNLSVKANNIIFKTLSNKVIIYTNSLDKVDYMALYNNISQLSNSYNEIFNYTLTRTDDSFEILFESDLGTIVFIN